MCYVCLVSLLLILFYLLPGSFTGIENFADITCLDFFRGEDVVGLTKADCQLEVQTPASLAPPTFRSNKNGN